MSEHNKPWWSPTWGDRLVPVVSVIVLVVALLAGLHPALAALAGALAFFLYGWLMRSHRS